MQRQTTFVLAGIILVAIVAFLLNSSSLSVTGQATKVTQVVSSCTDTDGGDIYTPGTVTYTIGKKPAKSLNDECVSSRKGDIVTEHTCGTNKNGKQVRIQTKSECKYGCADEMSCSMPPSPPCVPEKDYQICSRLNFNCGSLTAEDNCGKTRTVYECGPCKSGYHCTGNMCERDLVDPCGGCPKGYSCNAATATCVPSAENVTYPADPCGGCAEGYICNKETANCEPENALPPVNFTAPNDACGGCPAGYYCNNVTGACI